jgi:hypothetical protein
MAQIKLDFRQLDLLDFRKQAKAIAFVDSRTKLDRTRASFLKSSVSLAARLDSDTTHWGTIQRSSTSRERSSLHPGVLPLLNARFGG